LFASFGNVGYRTTCGINILCFAKHISSKETGMLEEEYGKA
jgi:hypothetical protein